MRSLIAVALLAGCTDTGAHLTLSAPAGTSADSFDVVLAAPEPVSSVNAQRVAPFDSTTLQTVIYFQQRTLAGVEATKIGDANGFTVRIAPDESIPDTQFIPFVILYKMDDAHRKIISGIGTYRDGSLMPSPILVLRDEIDKYKLTVETVIEPVDDSAALEAGQARQITCEGDGGTFVSGVVWHSLEGGEYRILFPDDGTLDATGRALDLDCDDHAVTVENSRPDCDDTRLGFNRDAPETCDGKDTNCDNQQTIATTCNLPTLGNVCDSPLSPGPNQGIQLCNDQTMHMTDCQASATCLCASQSGGCHFCQIPFAFTATQGTVAPCQPATGALRFLSTDCTDQTPCDVEVVGIRGGWKVEISAPGAGAWSNRAYDIPGSIDILAKRPELGYTQPGQTGQAVADVDLAIVSSTTTRLMALQLRLGGDGATCASEPEMLCY